MFIFHQPETALFPEGPLCFRPHSEEAEALKARTGVTRCSIQVDLEKGPINVLKGSDIGKVFRPDSFIHGESGAGPPLLSLFLMWATG